MEWRLVLAILNLLLGGGTLGLLLRLNLKWNLLLQRADLLYKEYCEEHQIPFVPLNGTFTK